MPRALSPSPQPGREGLTNGRTGKSKFEAERHPGYWRKKRSPPNALQDLAPSEVAQNQPIATNEIGLLAADFGLFESSKHSKAFREGALQDLAYVQVPLLAGVVSLLIGDALQDRFAAFTRELVESTLARS
jgi:hypothetical protein